MKLKTLILLALGNCSLILAAEYAIDSTCDQWHNGVKSSIQEALDLAENALKIMHDHATDEHIQTMSKLILGEEDFAAKFARVQVTFTNVKAYAREPGSFPVLSANTNTIFYCGDSRWDKTGRFWQDTSRQRVILSPKMTLACYKTDHVKGTPGIKALTGTHNTDIVGWIRARNANTAAGLNPDDVHMASFTAPTNYACSIDVCLPFLDKWADLGWPKLDKDRIEWALKLQTDQAPLPPVPAGSEKVHVYFDFIKTAASTMLHELTHTVQGGELKDVADGNCYDWMCVLNVKNPHNSDSISLLAIVYKMWSLGYYVDAPGNIQKIAD